MKDYKTETQEAYKKIIDELFKYDDNPTYELCGVTIDNMVGVQKRIDMEDAGLIKYVGNNHNNYTVYQIRNI